jgi:uncharacterized membrane protein
MKSTRLEAFSDGVIAILITIMVLELHAPSAPTWSALHESLPSVLFYLLSFVFLGIYWNNHHHMFVAVEHVNGAALWANLHLLFWLSLVPFVTEWMGPHWRESLPTVIYGIVLLASAIAFTILQRLLIAFEGPESKLAIAVSAGSWKEWASLGLYVLGIGLSFVSPFFGDACYVAVALIWIVPDRRIEALLKE